MAYGVVQEGFVVKPYTEILAEMEAKARELFGDDVDLTPTSPLYMFIEICALELARAWEMAEAYYYSAFIDFATGSSLDRVCSLIGVTRKAATPATGKVKFTGTAGYTIPAGFEVQTETGIAFITDEDVTLGTDGTGIVGVTAVVPGDEGNVAANTITVIVVPSANIDTVTNPDPTTGGTDKETDHALRWRAKDALEAVGKGTVSAIETAVLAVDGVTGVSSVEDLTTHTLTLTVSGVTKPNADVDAAIEETRPAGILVTWDVPTIISIYVSATIDVKDNVPADAESRLKDAIVSYINGLGAGDDVIYTKIIDIIYDEEEEDAEPWINDITELKIGTTSPPTQTTNIAIAANEEAQTSTDAITIILT